MSAEPPPRTSYQTKEGGFYIIHVIGITEQ